MSDVTEQGAPRRPRTAATAIAATIVRRRRKQMMLQGFGIAAILFAFLMLAILLTSLVSSGYKAFVQTHVTFEVLVDPSAIEVERLPRGDFDEVLEAALARVLSLDGGDRAVRRQVGALLSNGAQFELRDAVIAEPGLIGETIEMTVPVSDPFDQLAKGLVDRATPEGNRRVDDREVAFYDALDEAGAISQPLNWGLVTNADSRFPELAGLKGALVGSFWALLTCFLISFPLGDRGGDLSGGVRAAEPPDRSHRGEHQQPGGRALGRIRPARARGVHRLVRPSRARRPSWAG